MLVVSSLELVSATGILPPFLVDGQWVSVSEHEEAVCSVPSATSLYRTWKRAVDFLRRRGCLMPGDVCQVTGSAKLLGAKFPCSGVTWRVPVADRVRCEMAFQFSFCSSLGSGRILIPQVSEKIVSSFKRCLDAEGCILSELKLQPLCE